eukprot:m.395511 g.395511  ORF g.395511 m.395511 type:complete len:78 (+) comp56394_c0_seq8:37-270(+)
MSEEATVGQLRSSLAAHISHTRLNPPAPQAEDVEESDKQAKPAKVAGGVPTGSSRSSCTCNLLTQQRTCFHSGRTEY